MFRKGAVPWHQRRGRAPTRNIISGSASMSSNTLTKMMPIGGILNFCISSDGPQASICSPDLLARTQTHTRTHRRIHFHTHTHTHGQGRRSLLTITILFILCGKMGDTATGRMTTTKKTLFYQKFWPQTFSVVGVNWADGVFSHIQPTFLMTNKKTTIFFVYKTPVFGNNQISSSGWEENTK